MRLQKYEKRLQYYLLKYLNEKETLLVRTDSMFTEFLRVSTLRLKAGETNILESTSASNQKGALQLQLTQLAQDRETLSIQFSLLLNSGETFIPDNGPLQKQALPEPPITVSEQHPALMIMAQQQLIEKANTRLEKARMLPDLMFGYNNLSLRDGANTQAKDRFSSVQAGIGIPIFSKAQKARINASRLNEEISFNAYQKEKQAIERQYQESVSRYRKSKTDVAYYEQTGLKNAELIRKTLGRQLSQGEINYLEWTVLNQQALLIESDYLDAVKELNQNLIQIEYFQSSTNK